VRNTDRARNFRRHRDDTIHRPGQRHGTQRWFGRRSCVVADKSPDIGTLVGAARGLLALLAFSFSLALSPFEARCNGVLEEANAIGSAANYALMLQNGPGRVAGSGCP
jgi:hypothetical protein